MRIVASVLAPAPPDEVWAWWTDYGDVGTREHIDHGLGATTREVVEKSGNRYVFRERLLGGVGKLEHDAIVLDAERRVEEHYLGGVGVPYSATWRFEPEEGGRVTRITRVIDAEVPGPGFLGELAAPAARLAIERDLATHVREFERTRAPGGK